MVHLDLKIQSCPDFPAKTRQEMLSCPVLSRGFQKFECLDLSWNQISEYLKVLTCLDMHLCCLALSWIHIFVSVSCLVSSRKFFKILCLSRLVSSREFPVPTHPWYTSCFTHSKMSFFQWVLLKMQQFEFLRGQFCCILVLFGMLEKCNCLPFQNYQSKITHFWIC